MHPLFFEKPSKEGFFFAMKMKPLKLLFLRLTVLMIVYTLLRLLFFIYHSNLFHDQPEPDIFFSFLHGLRFDLAALCWINSLFFVLAMIPRFPGKLIKIFFYLINASFIITSLNDFELFTFNGKRLSREFFTSLGEDFWQQLPQVFIHYWYLPLGGVFLGWLLWKADSKIEHKLRAYKISFPYSIILAIFVPAVVFIAIRGGLQQKSIHIQSAFIQGSNSLGHLTLNTPYHFLRTFSAPLPQKKSWFTEQELVKKIQTLSIGQTKWGRTGDNVVLIILESFSLEYFEAGYMPFLQKLAKENLFFEKNFANGRRSIEVLSSVLDGVPSVQDVPFSKSSAQSMALDGIGTRLRNANYTSVFFHGAGRGSMGFETYTLAHGFHRYYSREDFDEGDDSFDGQWGIYDGPWLQFSLRTIDKIKSPFFAGIFTLSSHQPYSIPNDWKGKFSKGTLEIHESIGYTDHMLEEFFKVASEKEWFKNTLFIITADHTQKQETPKFLNSVGTYRVPLILFHPGAELPKDVSNKVTQHVDIPSTVLDWVNVSDAGLNFVGESVFAAGPGKALQYLQPGWQYVRGNRVLLWDGENEGKEYELNFKTGVLTATKPTDLETEAKVFVQYLLNGFRSNRWPVVRSE